MSKAEELTTSNRPGKVLSACLHAAAAAPSIHNTQPWLFRVTGGTGGTDGDLSGTAVEVRVDRSRRLTVLDPDGREMFVSVGAAVFNLRVALAAAGYRTTVHRADTDPDVAARIVVDAAEEPSAAARALHAAIPRRHTNRRPFADRRIPYGTMEELRGAAAAEHASLLDVGPELRDAVLNLTRTAEKRMRSDPAYLRELAAWTNPSGVGRADGMPRHVLGPRAKDATLPLRDLALGLGLPATTVEFEPEPTLVLLFTPDDSTTDWVRAGEAMQRVWLTATVRGLAVTPMSQLTEIAALRSLLSDIGTRYVAQMVLRIGHPQSPALPTPRRPLPDLLV
jgi:nitroreductase